MPEAFSVTVEKDVPMTTRDGTILRSDIYRPVAGQHPVILGRTQYGKDGWGQWIAPVRTAALGYAVVINDMRGQFASEGEFDPFVYDIEDSYDVVEWCAEQPWSNGKVGMYGSSSCGFVQLQAAVSQPPHLVAIAPMQTWSSFGRGCVYDPGGAFSMYTEEWALLQTTIDPRKRIGGDRGDYASVRQAAARGMWEVGRWHTHLPLRELPPLPGDVAPYYFRWLEHPDHDDFWATRNIAAQYERIQVPCLHLVGWFDRFCLTTQRNYFGIMAAGGGPARENQKIVFGPWPHGIPVADSSGDQHFGPDGGFDVRGLVIRWYDHWLKGIDNGIMAEPRVRLFTLGENAWHDETAWPPAPARLTTYYLHSGGRANSSAGDGSLSTDAPGEEPADSYLYDPGDPTPTVPGKLERHRGTVNQAAIETRNDVLVFSSPPLASDLEVSGPIVARMWASSSAIDTDWMVKLVDVYPDGYVYRLGEGMIRARYREGQDKQRFLEPGQVYEYEIEVPPTSNLFKAGHRIRVDIASASFPEFDRNFNTGGRFGEETRGIAATQLVFHDAQRPSHIVLPVIPRQA
ncbi:MAG: CocE/NonD family hydrolase [Chloroflexi bacterium]|nr:CocE/NonD family hydrolase [Chloroflexota bacterium]